MYFFHVPKRLYFANRELNQSSTHFSALLLVFCSHFLNSNRTREIKYTGGLFQISIRNTLSLSGQIWAEFVKYIISITLYLVFSLHCCDRYINDVHTFYSIFRLVWSSYNYLTKRGKIVSRCDVNVLLSKFSDFGECARDIAALSDRKRCQRNMHYFRQVT